MKIVSSLLLVLVITLTSVQCDETTPDGSSTASSDGSTTSSDGSKTPSAETTSPDIELSDDPALVRQAYCDSRSWLFTSGKKRELKWVVTMACECMRYQKWEKDAKKCYEKKFTDGAKFVNCTTLEGIEKFSCQDKFEDIEKEIKECVHFEGAKMETEMKHPTGDKCYKELVDKFNTEESWLGQVSDSATFEKPIEAAAKYHDCTPGDPDGDKKDPLEKVRSGFKFLLG